MWRLTTAILVATLSLAACGQKGPLYLPPPPPPPMTPAPAVLPNAPATPAASDARTQPAAPRPDSEQK